MSHCVQLNKETLGKEGFRYENVMSKIFQKIQDPSRSPNFEVKIKSHSSLFFTLALIIDILNHLMAMVGSQTSIFFRNWTLDALLWTLHRITFSLVVSLSTPRVSTKNGDSPQVMNDGGLSKCLFFYNGLLATSCTFCCPSAEL